jgi:hypothetical protein
MMSTFELLKTHYHKRGPDGLARLDKVKPYILLKQGRDDPPVYLKGGVGERQADSYGTAT